MKFTCEGCRIRKIGCHAKCEQYLHDKTKHNQEKKKRELEALAAQSGSHAWKYIK